VTIPPQRGKRVCRDILAELADLPLNRTAPSQMLIEHCRALISEGVTPILFTTRPVQASLPGRSDTGLIAIAANSEQARAWFQFDPSVDFSRCMPMDQLSGIMVY
jgi:hypothetical protein